MSEIGTSESASTEAEKPVHAIDDVKFPPFPEPTDRDFEEDVLEEERSVYKSKFPDLNAIVNVKLHCTACDRHLGCSARNESRMRPHPMLRTLICLTCHSFYNSGEFDKGEDGSELYCRWCGQGGQVYCCSDCIHVFCAKCIKRNLGIAKIKEIENTDDWKCFKCNPKCLWELRAVCWALLRYCDIRNKIVHHTEDPELKEKYQKAISIDTSECCKNKGRRKEKTDSAKKKEKEAEQVKKILPKLPPTIQVKKFASINLDDGKIEKKAQKRPASPKPKISYINKPISIAPCPLSTPSIIKKIRLPTGPLLNPTIRFSNEKKICQTYTRMPSRPRQPYPIPISNTPFNGIHNPFAMNLSPSLMGDNINLSLETLTQGLDMAAVAAFNNPQSENDVVCTPDFPLEPLCEVTEDNDDDVECITPGPVVHPKINNPPPLVPRSLPEFSSDNIVQMTENDVTVNTVTGGLKFRVDPQTLSSKKMYRLPDGRIFAINPNPNMPGGYSATIVSVSDGTGKVAPKGGETFAAKLSAITASPTTPASNSKTPRNTRKPKAKSTPRPKGNKLKETPGAREPRESDFKVPVEWYRYNLIDAVDALDYSLSRLNKLKKEATTSHLRTRTVDEIKYLHRTLEQLLTTSSKRFLEIRESLNKELKQYITRRLNTDVEDTGDITEDDDVEFLPNAGNDDPIFIDENSVDSINVNESQEVDLTGVGSSEHNDSGENKNESDPLLLNENSTVNDKDTTDATVNCNDSSIANDKNANNTTVNCNDSMMETQSPKMCDTLTEDDDIDDANDKQVEKKQVVDVDEKRIADLKDQVKAGKNQDAEVNEKQIADSNDEMKAGLDKEEDNKLTNKQDSESMEDDDDISDTEDTLKSNTELTSVQKTTEINGESEKTNHSEVESMDVDGDKQSLLKDKVDQVEDPIQDTDMSEEMIETLLKGDTFDGIDVSNMNSLDVPEEPGDKQ